MSAVLASMTMAFLAAGFYLVINTINIIKDWFK
nr:MAG TPA: hypothetical protein [Microviridae sp.]